MTTSLDRSPPAASAQTWEGELAARSGMALKTIRRLLRAVASAWRFAHACMRLARIADEGGAAPVADPTSLRDRDADETAGR